MENDLDFVSDNLLSTNDAEVIAKKRENFKEIVFNFLVDKIENCRDSYAWMLSEGIVRETFDKSVVN
jgi:hypothetical protein